MHLGPPLAKLRLAAVVLPAFLLAAVGFSTEAHAQAWVLDKGTLSGTFAYSLNRASDIIETTRTLSGDPTVQHGVTTIVEYVPINKLAIQAQLPVFVTSFNGRGTNPIFAPHGDLDDGKTHLSVQDVRVDARYAALELPVAVAPIVGFSIPTNNYEIQGFGAPGRGLKQLHLGVAVGGTLAPWVPRLFAQVQYEFALVEKLDKSSTTSDFGQNYSRYSAQIGYFVLDALNVYAALDGLIYHDGVSFEEFADYDASQKDFHDALLKERAMYLGGGARYGISNNLGVGAAVRAFIEGENTRKSLIVLGTIDWTFELFRRPSTSEEEVEATASTQQ